MNITRAIAVWALLAATPFVILVRAYAIDGVWWQLVEAKYGPGPGVAVWYGLLLVWSASTYNLKRIKEDDHDELLAKAQDKLIAASTYAYLRHMLVSGGIVIIAALMRLFMGWA